MEEYDEEEEEVEGESGGYGWLWAVLGLAAAGGGAYYWFSLRPKQIIEAEKKAEEDAKVKVESDYQTKLTSALATDPAGKPGMAKLAVDVEYPTVRYLDGRTERVSPEKKAELLASGKFRKGDATGRLLLEIDPANPTANTAPKHADAATGDKRGMSFGGKKK